MRYRLLIFCVLILMSGCSRIKLAYHQLDWLIPYYLESYLPLTAKQSDYLEDHVEMVLNWHCQDQVGAYAKLLRQTDTNIQSGQMTRERFMQFADHTKQFWRQVMKKMYPVIVKLLYEAEPQQLQALFEALNESNRKWFDEYQALSQTEIYDQNHEKILDVLEDWIGALDSKQKQFLKKWVSSYKPLGKTGYTMRHVWQIRLQKLTKNRHNKAVFDTGIETMLVNPKTIRLDEYQQHLDYNQKVTIDLLVAISASMQPEQRRHLAQKINDIAVELEELVCAPDQQYYSQPN